jgi:hypothetical protein
MFTFEDNTSTVSRIQTAEVSMRSFMLDVVRMNLVGETMSGSVLWLKARKSMEK